MALEGVDRSLESGRAADMPGGIDDKELSRGGSGGDRGTGGKPPASARGGGEGGRVLVLQPEAAGAVFVGERRSVDADLSTWRRYHRLRDLAILVLLAQHTYLTSRDLHDLCWPHASEQAARKRLLWMVKRGVVERWWQLLPSMPGWRRRPSVYMLSNRGARIAAEKVKADPKPLAQRAYYAANGAGATVRHDLEANAFFVSLAAASSPLPGEGLYTWVGEVGMRRDAQIRQELRLVAEEAGLAPDGFGRYLLPGARMVAFHLEHDRGAEPPPILASKARRYLEHAPEGDQVLFLLPNVARERTIRGAVAQAGAGHAAWAHREVRCWTTTAQRLEDEGPLGAIWRGFGGDDGERRRLTELPNQPAPPGLEVAHSLGKVGWWNVRPGAGEGM